MMSLTARETAALIYLAGHIEARGFCPSYREIGRVVGLWSTGRVAALVDSLGAKGALCRIPQRARAMMPTGPVPMPRAPTGEPLFFVPIGGVA